MIYFKNFRIFQKHQWSALRLCCLAHSGSIWYRTACWRASRCWSLLDRCSRSAWGWDGSGGFGDGNTGYQTCQQLPPNHWSIAQEKYKDIVYSKHIPLKISNIDSPLILAPLGYIKTISVLISTFGFGNYFYVTPKLLDREFALCTRVCWLLEYITVLEILWYTIIHLFL